MHAHACSCSDNHVHPACLARGTTEPAAGGIKYFLSFILTSQPASASFLSHCTLRAMAWAILASASLALTLGETRTAVQPRIRGKGSDRDRLTEPTTLTSMPSPFQVGSGAMISSTDPLGQAPATVEADRLKLSLPVRPKTLSMVSLTFCLSVLCMMMPAGIPQLAGGGISGSSRDFNYRIPPAWSPEN